ncbi:MBL fold metallo-hydrolase [Actinosynnema sp. ALI-1.44]|uniref:MBL fold metallo-hydrolase n=1 Tax=Actinosynnema sp. ALI-1.44 TaxID=1933779 RepID=UPI00097C72A7|nr:MBL fold metallo-hydrolase [Actinosynnema sp. ALI-1.44]ONI76474.1 MBL fold metallo-hydrolase [Actinosynnema sp. ALI-1.44]
MSPSGELHEVAEGVFAYVQPDGGWCLNNAGILVGADAVTLVDTAATEQRARNLRSAIATVTPLPPRIVVNTHHHGDHTGGNFVFTPSATVVAHAATRTQVLEKGLGLTKVWPDTHWGELVVSPPTLTFTDRMTLHQGDMVVELRHIGPAHTTNDVFVWLPAQRVLFTGDLVMSGCTPFFFMGSLLGSLRAVRALRRLGAKTVVCGHGPVCGPEVFDVNETYLRWVHQLARDGLAAGLDPLTLAMRTDLGEFAALLDPERLVANLHRAYDELQGNPPGRYLSSAPVFEQMRVYNGGPLTCLA